MKVIFLDFDGVLNHQELFLQRHLEGGGDPDDAIDPACVERLNRLIQETGAKVVVSSTWRILKTLDVLQEILDKRGFVGELIGKTTTDDLGCRGNQIAEWLSHNEVDSFVILDDDSDMGDLIDHLVRTDIRNGLLDEHVLEAINILSAEVA